VTENAEAPYSAEEQAAGYAGLADDAPGNTPIAESRSAKRDAASAVQEQPGRAGEYAGARDLGEFELRPFANAEGRLLEYRVNVQYRTEDFPAARRNLFALASEYGYLNNSSARAGESRVASMNAEMRVKSEDLYEVLEELNALGRLEHEDIQVTDHTENMFIQSLKQDREALRQARRARASRGTETAQKNWAEIERLLAESEDRADQTQIEQWRIRDRTAWDSVQISLLGSELPAEIDVPAYGNAFVALANFLLDLLYVLILLLPLWLAIAGIWFLRGRIARFFGSARNARTAES